MIEDYIWKYDALESGLSSLSRKPNYVISLEFFDMATKEDMLNKPNDLIEHGGNNGKGIAGCYLFWDNGHPLYAGKAIKLLQRLRDHWIHQDSAWIREYWRLVEKGKFNGVPIVFVWLTIPTERAMVEAELITKLSPYFNKKRE